MENNKFNNKYLNFNYETSKDYDTLFELIKTQRVVCFVQSKDMNMQNVCASQKVKNEDFINIGTIGIGYISACAIHGLTVKEDFIAQCTYYELEYIMPKEK